jgi:hypothetical protein
MKHADLLGFGRSSVLCPHLPALIYAAAIEENGDLPQSSFVRHPVIVDGIFKRAVSTVGNSLVGAGVEMAWYIVTLRQIASTPVGETFMPNYSLSGPGALFWMWAWGGPPGGSKMIRAYVAACIGVLAILLCWIFVTGSSYHVNFW